MLDFLNKFDDIAALVAAKTVENLFAGRNAERRRLFLVKRTQSEQIE